MRLAAAMTDPAPTDPDGDNPDLPVGYAFLAQFIEHDLTWRAGTAQGTVGAPRLALDCLYADGPQACPALYDASEPAKLSHGATGPARRLPRLRHGGPHDLPRNGAEVCVADPRSDANLIVAQTHIALARFHAAIVDRLPSAPDAGAAFAAARAAAMRRYHGIVADDLLPRICDPGRYAAIRAGERYQHAKAPLLPDEFTAAAFRMGHALLREEYDVNCVFSVGGRSAPATLSRLMGLPDAKDGALRPLGADWVIDWRRFFAFPDAPEGARVNLCRLLRPRLAPSLSDAARAGGVRSLAAANLMRGRQIGLPCGQDVARAIGARPLSAAQASTGRDGAAAAAAGLHLRSPLWFYVLKEAEALWNGRRLGPVGTQIVAETLLAAIEAASEAAPACPQEAASALSGRASGRFDMVDLLMLGGEIDPLGAALD